MTCDAGTFPKIVFGFLFDDAGSFDTESRGYLSHVFVEFEDGSRCPVYFYDPVRLQQDLEAGQEFGRSFIAEPGMIVIPKVTLPNMQFAIQQLFQEGFFDSLVRIVPASQS